MKKHIFITVCIALSLLMPNFAYSENSENTIDQKLQSIGFFSFMEADDQKEITKIFKNQTKYSNQQNIKKLQTLYADDYQNFDGLSRTDFFNMIGDTWKLYSNLSYTSEIKNIVVNGSYADVEVVEITKGKTKTPCETTKKIGNIASESTIIYNLEKFGKTWKITSDNILKEQTYLLYGEANDLAMSLYTPSQIRAGKQYNVTFDIKLPKGYYAIASITNEDIVFPQKPPREVFRNVKQDTKLERVITSNKNNHNEYAVASIGLTKPKIENNGQIQIDVVGLGFLMNRVNILPLNKGQ